MCLTRLHAALREVLAGADRVPEHLARLARAGWKPGQAIDDDMLRRLPILRKSARRELQSASPPWGGMLTDGFQPQSCFMSPGGIVEPLVERMSQRLAGMLQEAGFGPGHTVLNGFSYHVTPAGMLFHSALVRAGCTVLPAGPQNTALLAEYAQALQANAFVGIASHLKILLDQQPGLRITLAMAGAEPHVDALRAQLRARHGVQCFDMYGFAEAGIIAASCEAEGSLHLHPDVLAEVISPGNDEDPAPEGAAGELVVTLNNPGFPLLRFGTGDLVRIDPRTCACGRTGVLQVLGRADQSVRVKGMLLHPTQVQRFLAVAGADACRLAVTRHDDRDRISVALKFKTAGASITDAASLGQAFQEACRVRADQFEIDESLAPESCAIEDWRGTAVAHG